MTREKKPKCGDWFKLVESLALKRHDEGGKEVSQGDFFRFLGFSAAEGFCECYSPRLHSRFWIKLDYLFPVRDPSTILDLELAVPDEFKQPTDKIRSHPKFSNDLARVMNQTTEED